MLDIQQSLLQSRWVHALANSEIVDRIARLHAVPEVVARLLASRNVAPDAVEQFLNPTLARDFPDPLKMAGMDAAATMLADAIVTRRKIGIFGDFDVDGATSTALLVRLFRHCGLDAPFYIPDRTREGYGPNIKALQHLKEQGVELVVMVDCGITAHAVIAQGRALGLDIIVLDHHQAESDLPPANHVVNPNRRDDNSGLGMLAACGVTFLTCVAVNTKLKNLNWFVGHGMSSAPLKDWLDIVALGTVCDMVPLTGANRLFVRHGLTQMAQSKNPGINALRAVAGLSGEATPYQLGFALGPRINAGSRVHQADLGARLLCTDDPEEARNIAFTLNDCNNRRKEIEAEMVAYAHQLVEEGNLQEHPVIIVGHETWHPGLSGLVAGRLREKHEKPAVVIAYAPGDSGALEGRGSGRSIPGVNLGAAFIDARISDLALKGGGHAMAAGFTIRPDQLKQFSTFVTEHVRQQLRGHIALTDTIIDGILSVRGATPELIRQIYDRLGPFGQGHDEPLFALADVRVHMVDRVGTDHVRAVVSDWEGGPRLKAIAFRSAGTPLGQALLNHSGNEPLHLLGHFKLDTWNGVERVELHIQDAAFATLLSDRLRA